MWPTAYREFVERHALVGREIEIAVAEDLSGVGASIGLFSEVDATGEANDFYPGLVVKEDGYVPIGGCLTGCGDPYFINVRDVQPGPVYRIYHDSVFDRDYDREAAIARVLDSYESLLRFVEN